MQTAFHPQGAASSNLKWGLKWAVLLVPAVLFLACGGEANEEGRELFERHCAQCHGVDGTGDPRQRRLYQALDLTRSELVLTRANGIIYRRIAYGWGAMPGFSHKLPHPDLQALTDYTLSLAARPAEE